MGDTMEHSSEADQLYAINVTIALLAILLFVIVGSQVIPGSLNWAGLGTPAPRESTVAFLLNISLIIFAWRRSVEFQHASLARRAAERRANEFAYKDDITGLFNRRHLMERIDAAATEHSGALTLLLIDIDHFKTVNDLYGHPMGDRLLAAIARKIVAVSPPSACCVRLGGDEFAILLVGSDAEQDKATSIAKGLLAEIDKPIQLEAIQAHISASIGLSTLNSASEAPNTLMQRSDIAMYVTKVQGRNGYTWFDAGMERALSERTLLEAEMRSGIIERQFVPYFQPLLDTQSGELKGFEVLARWEHPTKGIVEPDSFIPAAETTGLIGELSFDVMRQALTHARDWPAHLTIAVNISPIQFKDPMLALRIVKLLVETRFAPQRLELELTESTLLHNRDQALSTVESLKNHGIRISLDDFGTGYASLTQLRALPFDSIKIDRSFVASLLEDEQSYSIIHAITTLGRNMNLPITAEGVETIEIFEKLRGLGCSHAQGWLFGKAISAADTERKFLQAGNAAPEPSTAQSDEDLQRPTLDRRDYARRGR